jgi:amino acid transporter
MGRDEALPKRFFAHLSKGSNTPTYNIVLIGIIAAMGAIGLNYIGNAYEHAGELLNFGAFLAFMGVNLSTFWHFCVVTHGKRRTRIWGDIAVPLTGFGFSALIWWNLNPLAKFAGGLWFAAGLAYLAVTTKGFRRAPKQIDFSES